MKAKKILFICPYPENLAPSQRLKFEQYYHYFREAEYVVDVSPFISKGFFNVIYKKGFFLQKIGFTLIGYVRRIKNLFQLHKYDIVYVHLWATPFGPPFFEWIIRKLSKRIVYDIDDLVYLKDVKSKVHPLVTMIKGRKKPIYLMKGADHVITCTPYLDQFVRKYNQNTTDISSTINTDVYQPKTDYRINEKPVIGWSGSHSTSKYLHLLDPVFQELAKKYPFRLLVMGDADFRIDGVEVEAVAWKEEYEVAVLSRFDIGVYPLPNEEWVLGKSGLKALQYMALGIPTVATDIGTIHRIIRHEENGFLVSSPEEWKQAILNLMQDQNLRESIGRKAAITVQSQYSVKANQKNYLRILDGLARS